mmetsp:Transcript_3601/g.13768  ORF Transcript_3601/g.13768 Transcript_3601/m.13768 type:complete len:146 (+) Transcript_3601:79-516(+)
MNILPKSLQPYFDLKTFAFTTELVERLQVDQSQQQQPYIANGQQQHNHTTCHETRPYHFEWKVTSTVIIRLRYKYPDGSIGAWRENVGSGHATARIKAEAMIDSRERARNNAISRCIETMCDGGLRHVREILENEGRGVYGSIAS